MLSSKIARGLTSSFLVLALCGSALADTIRLKDGSIIKGKIVSFSGGKFTVSVGTGARQREMKFAAAEVDSVTFDSDSDDRNASYKPEPKPATPQTTKPVTPPTAKPSFEKMTPIRIDVKVLADATANGWTNTGWVVKKGQRIFISGSGRASLGHGHSSPPSGIASLP